MPLPQGPFDQRRATLEWLASQGRADAAYELGRIVTACVDYEPVPDYAFVTMLAQATSWLASFRGGNPGLPEPSELVELVIHTREEMEVLCRGTEALRNGRGTGDGHRWLLQAASAGHAAAMARYAHASLAEYASSNALLDHAREVAMRRDRGRVFLERALAAGEQAALLEYSRAYGDGGVFEPDAVRAQAYWRAYRSTPAGRQVPAAADRMRLRGLSDTEARESERLARRIEARFQQARRRR